MIRTKNPLSWQFNQQMILENHSLFQCLALIREEGTDILKNTRVSEDEMIALLIKLV